MIHASFPHEEYVTDVWTISLRIKTHPLKPDIIAALCIQDILLERSREHFSLKDTYSYFDNPQSLWYKNVPLCYIPEIHSIFIQFSPEHDRSFNNLMNAFIYVRLIWNLSRTLNTQPGGWSVKVLKKEQRACVKQVQWLTHRRVFDATGKRNATFLPAGV